jgi:hypothetical protein
MPGILEPDIENQTPTPWARGRQALGEFQMRRGLFKENRFVQDRISEFLQVVVNKTDIAKITGGDVLFQKPKEDLVGKGIETDRASHGRTTGDCNGHFGGGEKKVRCVVQIVGGWWSEILKMLGRAGDTLCRLQSGAESKIHANRYRCLI